MLRVYLIVSLNSGRAKEAVRGNRRDVLDRLREIEEEEQQAHRAAGAPEFTGPDYFYPRWGSRYRIDEVPFLDEPQRQLFS